MVISPNLPSYCGKLESVIAYFYQLSLIVLIVPHRAPKGSKPEVLVLAHGSMQQSAIAGRVGLTHAATRILVPGNSTRLPEDHSSSIPCFVEDGPTGSLHKRSGFNGTDEEFVWNEDWPENHQQPGIFPWLPCS